MAKPLGSKSVLIRDAITSHPNKGNTEIAEMLNGDEERKADRIKVSARDVATQRQAMRKVGTPARARRRSGAKKPGRKGGRKPARKQPPAAATPTTAQAPAADLFEHIEAIREAVRQLGAEQVKKIVGLFE